MQSKHRLHTKKQMRWRAHHKKKPIGLFYEALNEAFQIRSKTFKQLILKNRFRQRDLPCTAPARYPSSDQEVLPGSRILCDDENAPEYPHISVLQPLAKLEILLLMALRHHEGCYDDSRMLPGYSSKSLLREGHCCLQIAPCIAPLLIILSTILSISPQNARKPP